MRIYLFLLLLLSPLWSENSGDFGYAISEMFTTFSKHKEVGIDYSSDQNLKTGGSAEPIHDFKNSGISPYLSIKSDAFSIGESHFGTYLNSTLRYNSFNRQRGLFSNGLVYDKEDDLGTSINTISFSSTPSLFYYIDLNAAGKVVSEVFTGAGTTIYWGDASLFQYPTQEEYNNLSDNNQSDIFTTLSDGRVAYIEPPVDLGFVLGLNFIYGLKLKYIYENWNIHFLYEVTTVFALSGGDNLDIEFLSWGVGYSF
jgi:hypothetical protein